MQYKPYESAINQEIAISGDYELMQSQFSVGGMPFIEQTNEKLATLKGSLQQVFAFLLNVNTAQVQLPSYMNKPYTLILDRDKDKADILSQIQNQLKISFSEEQKQGKSIDVTLISYDRLWDRNQIDWGYRMLNFWLMIIKLPPMI